ncbi:hypothetical protein FB45DRAFT_1067747 [Roridomyces roridus]|uniref:Uncharacterized protein n=1 Tax=Roridomyces roridus TaxID=1738132 RepID=A0AAD7B1C3_9AGAR|nr:hypothetical protein FB45DRAFT_1067747 [Roridomyces roridus]
MRSISMRGSCSYASSNGGQQAGGSDMHARGPTTPCQALSHARSTLPVVSPSSSLRPRPSQFTLPRCFSRRFRRFLTIAEIPCAWGIYPVRYLEPAHAGCGDSCTGGWWWSGRPIREADIAALPLADRCRVLGPVTWRAVDCDKRRSVRPPPSLLSSRVLDRLTCKVHPCLEDRVKSSFCDIWAIRARCTRTADSPARPSLHCHPRAPSVHIRLGEKHGSSLVTFSRGSKVEEACLDVTSESFGTAAGVLWLHLRTLSTAAHSPSFYARLVCCTLPPGQAGDPSPACALGHGRA